MGAFQVPSHTCPWPPCGLLPSTTCFCTQTRHYRHPHSYWLRLFSSQTFFHINTPTFSNLVILHTYPPMKMEQTQCSETPAYKIQTPGNYPEESIRHTEHGKSLKSRMCTFLIQNDHYRKPAFNVTVNNIVLQFAIHQKGMEDPTKYISQTISMYLTHYSQCIFCSVELHY